MNDNYFENETLDTFDGANVFNLGSAEEVDYNPFDEDEPVEVAETLDNSADEPTEIYGNTDDADEQEQPSKVIEIPTTQKVAKPQNSSPKETLDEANPFTAALSKAEDEQAKTDAGSLFSKAPVFDYGGAVEEIANSNISFEQLRIDKSTDFPELEDGKKISWTMEYGSIKKPIANPKETIISKLKSEIETSKEFLETLKKAKDKNPACKVKPTIRAQSKGIASYKGVFPTLGEAMQSDKVICILPAKDGNVYEMRKTPMGIFTTKAENIAELSEVDAGFMPALPLVPFCLLTQVISFFRHFMKNGLELEALVHIYWDIENEEYHIAVPKQFVEKAHVSATFSIDDVLDEEKYIHFADIHSHNSMPAMFSAEDDRDERAARVYIVIGKLNQYFPEISARISNGGRYLPIPLSTIVQGIPNEFPQYWTETVSFKAPIKPVRLKLQ